MKDKKNIVIAILVIVIAVLSVLLVLNKKEVKVENTQEGNSTQSESLKSSNDITYECTKEMNEEELKATLKVILVRDGDGSITSFKSGTVNTYETEEEYNATKSWAKENDILFDELGNNTLYQYSDISNDYKDVWFKNIYDFYKNDGYNCITK